MNHLLDCPLKLPLKRAVSLMKLCEVSAFIVNKKGRILAVSNVPEETLSAKAPLKNVLLTPFSKLKAMQAGELMDVRLKGGEEETAVAACFCQFYFILLSSNAKAVKKSLTEKSVGFEAGGRIGAVAKESYSREGKSTENRRDMKVSPKQKSGAVQPLRDVSVRDKLEKTVNKRNLSKGFFDPAKALEAVCVIATAELAKHKVRLHTNLALSLYLSSADENAYFIALSMLLMTGADNAAGKELSVEGSLKNGEYVASVVLEKAPRFENAAANWHYLFGDYAVQLKELAAKHFWHLDIHRRADGKACISLSVRVTQKSSVSFLHYGKDDLLCAVALKRLSSFKATNSTKKQLSFGR